MLPFLFIGRREFMPTVDYYRRQKGAFADKNLADVRKIYAFVDGGLHGVGIG